MAAPIKMPFLMWTSVGPRNDVLGGGPDCLRKRYFWGGWHQNFPISRQAPFPVALMLGFPCMLLATEAV